MNALGTAALPAALANRAGSADALALATLVREAVASGADRKALHLRLSSLNDTLTRDHHHRLIREALEPLLRPSRSRLFELPNGDVVAVVPGSGSVLGAVERTLGMLFSDSDTNQPFVTLRLPAEAAALLSTVEDSLGPGSRPDCRRSSGRGFSGQDLAVLERALSSASLAVHQRRRPVCRLAPGQVGAQTVWQDCRVMLAELFQELLPGRAPEDAPWLHRRLRRLVERRLLADLSRPEDVRDLGRIGLAMSIAGLTEPEFLRLDAALGPERRPLVTIGIAAAEVLTDPAGFAFVRDFCRGRGYRLALEDAEAATLRLLPAARLQVDVVKVHWSPALTGLAEELPTLLPPGPDATVLCSADRAAAIGWAWEQGITLFQGQLVMPQRR